MPEASARTGGHFQAPPAYECRGGRLRCCHSTGATCRGTSLQKRLGRSASKFILGVPIQNNLGDELPRDRTECETYHGATGGDEETAVLRDAPHGRCPSGKRRLKPHQSDRGHASTIQLYPRVLPLTVLQGANRMQVIGCLGHHSATSWDNADCS